VQDRPTVHELLRAVRAFLERDVVPVVDGPRRFHARVAANVLAIADRELEGEEAELLDEWRRLAVLLDEESVEPPARLDGLRAAVREWTTILAERIRRGDADGGRFRDAVRAHVRATVRRKLAVANPRVLGGEPT